jgi:thymidylate kinase
MQGSKASRLGRLDFDLQSLNEVLTFVEQYVSMNSFVRPTLNEEFIETATLLPNRILAEIEVETRSLLSEPKRPIGKLVVVTGLSKAGKETQMSNPFEHDGVTPLTDWLQQRGYKVMTSRTSFDGMTGGLIACFLGRAHDVLVPKGSLDRNLAWILWSLERARRSERAGEWLSQDERNVLLAKRWTESNLAYHSVWGVQASRILGFERNILKPDCILNLDVSLDSVEQRNEASSPRSPVWSEKETRSIGKSFLQLEELYPFGCFFSVDADRSPSEVNGSLLDILGGLFP